MTEGSITGVAADFMTAWDDLAAVPTGDPVIAAIAQCDDMADVVNVVAGEASVLASGGEDASIDDTLETWRALGPEIDAAQATL